MSAIERRPDDNYSVRAFPFFDPQRSSGPIRGTGRYGMLAPSTPQSALILRATMTLTHFSVSSAMNFPNAAGVIDIGSTPMPASRAFMMGSAAMVLVSLLSLSIKSAGVSFGAPTPYHWLAS